MGNYADYVNLMMPERPGTDAEYQKRNSRDAFEDSFVRLPDSEYHYFNYADYVNLMMPERPGTRARPRRRRSTERTEAPPAPLFPAFFPGPGFSCEEVLARAWPFSHLPAEDGALA